MNGTAVPLKPSPASADPIASEEIRRPMKRQRVSQACSTCRDRKTRCDGRQPVCLACEQRGVANTCKFDLLRRSRARPLASSPHAASRLESTVRSHPSAHSDAAQALSDLGKGQQLTSSERRSVLAPAPPARLSQSHFPQHVNKSQGPPFTSLSSDGWNAPRADGLATIAADNDNSMYGPSSTVAFLRHVMPGQSRQGSITPGRSHSDAFPPRISAAPDRLPSKTEGFAVLPRRRQADNFVFCFWEFVHPLFPVLHRSTFDRQYEALWNEDEPVHANGESEAEEAIFMATLNLVFALGCKFSSQVESSSKALVADDFYQRSRQSYPFDILDSTSISLVQMLILTGVYLQSTERASRCWNSIGLAIRMAQSLGLHVDHKARSQMELQMRRRIWHTCVHLDRLLSMTFGRPSMIDLKVDVAIPDLIDDEYLESDAVATQPAHVPSRLGLFISSCKLFELLEEILELFYRDDSGVSSQRQGNGATRASDLLEPVLGLNRRLDQFAEDIPEYLRAPEPGTPASSNEDHVHLQQQVLCCRFLYVRLLSLRPLLLMATRREVKSVTHSSLDDDVIRSCCNRCTLTACLLIDTLYDNLGTLYRSSGWHTVYFAFTSAMVLLASSKIDDTQARPSESDVEASWTRCFLILGHYKDQIHSAGQASQILKTIKTRLTGVSRSQAPPKSYTPAVPLSMPADDGHVPAPELEMYPQLQLNDIDFSDAWFGQQLINLDWLELP